jgi:uncharacterized protein YciI
VAQFVYLISPKRADFHPSNMTEREREVMGIHFGHLQQLLAEEKLILAGPCLDGKYGICVLEADSEAEARRMMESDPAVVHGVMNCELHHFRVSLFREPAG